MRNVRRPIACVRPAQGARATRINLGSIGLGYMAMAMAASLGASADLDTPGFVMRLVLKDMRLALAEAEYAGSPMPSVNVVRDRLIKGIARSYAGLDWTGLGQIADDEAGISSKDIVVGSQ